MCVTNENEQTAVNELLREDSPEGFNEMLDAMFEAWVCSSSVSNTTSEQRTSLYCDYKAIKQFFVKLKKSKSMALKI